MTITTPLNITPEQRENLRKLADGLEANASRIKFDMSVFNENGDEPFEAVCGTVGCIVGNAPFLGIPEFEPLPGDKGWRGYSYRLFTPHNNLWRWLFNSGWCGTDNTLSGAIKRIRWTLENGLPDNWSDQVWRDAPLCYMEAEE